VNYTTVFTLNLCQIEVSRISDRAQRVARQSIEHPSSKSCFSGRTVSYFEQTGGASNSCPALVPRLRRILVSAQPSQPALTNGTRSSSCEGRVRKRGFHPQNMTRLHTTARTGTADCPRLRPMRVLPRLRNWSTEHAVVVAEFTDRSLLLPLREAGRTFDLGWAGAMYIATMPSSANICANPSSASTNVRRRWSAPSAIAHAVSSDRG